MPNPLLTKTPQPTSPAANEDLLTQLLAQLQSVGGDSDLIAQFLRIAQQEMQTNPEAALRMLQKAQALQQADPTLMGPHEPRPFLQGRRRIGDIDLPNE